MGPGSAAARNSFASPTYPTFDETGLGELFWSPVAGGIGLLRPATLYVNGRHPKIATFRRIGAALGIVIWLQLIAALASSSVNVLQAASTESGTYPVLLVFDGATAMAILQGVTRIADDLG